MSERAPIPSPELSITPQVIEALKGDISEPLKTISQQPGSEGKVVEVRIAKDGPGLFGLTDWQDNKEWSGITNHVLLSARYAVYFAEKLKAEGFQTDPQRILNGMIVSHPGRRQWDEAGWYPEVVENAQEKRSISNETLGMQLIWGEVPQDAFELVVALGHNVEGFSVDPSIFQSWDFKLSIYVDHRTAQKYEPLNTRMGDFLLGNFFQRNEITAEVRENVYSAIGNIIERQKNYQLGLLENPVTIDEADQIAASVGASPDSARLARKELMRLILQDAETEAALINAGVDPEGINDETVPMPAWEDKFRRDYVKSAEESIVKKLSQLYDHLLLPMKSGTPTVDNSVLDEISTSFPQNTWWGKYAQDLYDEAVGKNSSSVN